MASFAGTGLKEVTIPENVTSIGFCAFGYEEDMETVVDGFVVHGVSGSQAETYCTDSDDDNDYANNFTFSPIAEDSVDVATETTVQVNTKKDGFFKQYGKWILMGIGALVLLIGGIALIFSGKEKKSSKEEAKTSDTQTEDEK
jgi:hypothetical protein